MTHMQELLTLNIYLLMLTLLHSKWSKLYVVLAILSAIGLNKLPYLPSAIKQRLVLADALYENTHVII